MQNTAEIVLCHFSIARFNMFKQSGISSVELLLCLTIISSVSAYTLTMSEEVEATIQTYQHETNVKEMLKKIKTSSPNTANAAPEESSELLQNVSEQVVDSNLEQLAEPIELTHEEEITSHS